MNSDLQELQDLYRIELGSAALTYLEIGLALFHGYEPDYPQYRVDMRADLDRRPALGNLAVAVELMLKAFVASKHLSLLFKNLSLEMRTILTCPDGLPADFNWRSIDKDLRLAYSIEFEECISIFRLFFPEWRWLESYLKLLKRARNASLHAFLPSFQQYELEHAARVALQVYEILEEAQLFGKSSYKYTSLDELFINRYDDEKVQRVRNEIDRAEKRSKTLDNSCSQITHALGDWKHFVISCPICGCDCMLEGNTERLPNPFDDIQRLSFYADSLKCSHCGLTLNDSQELGLAGIDWSFDRSDELDIYNRDQGDHIQE